MLSWELMGIWLAAAAIVFLSIQWLVEAIRRGNAEREVATLRSQLRAATGVAPTVDDRGELIRRDLAADTLRRLAAQIETDPTFIVEGVERAEYYSTANVKVSWKKT